MKWFLKAKHWQLFLLVFALPISFITGGLILTNYYFNPAILFYLFPLSIAIVQFGIYFWMWVVGSHLYKQNSRTIESGFELFRLFILIPMVTLGVILIFWLLGATFFSLGRFSVADVLYGSLFVILPIQFLILISMFYCFMFVARAIKIAEKKQVVKFEAYVIEFILVMIPFIGFWFIQPRINKLAMKK